PTPRPRPPPPHDPLTQGNGDRPARSRPPHPLRPRGPVRFPALPGADGRRGRPPGGAGGQGVRRDPRRSGRPRPGYGGEPGARGPGRFAPFEGADGRRGHPRAESGGKGIEIYPDGPYRPRLAYGDVTGDGQLEAVVPVQCFLSGGGTGPTGHGGHLLVVGRSGDGTLNGLGWVGPYG